MKIYKLVSTNTPKVYIGSTSESLRTRLTKHKYHAKKNHLKSTHELFANNAEVKIELVRDCPNMNKNELQFIEGTIIAELADRCVNIRKPTGVVHRRYLCAVCNKSVTLMNKKAHERTRKHIELGRAA